MPLSEATPYGFRVTACCHLAPAEAEHWAGELRRMVARRGSARPFGLLMDARGQRTQLPATAEILQQLMGWLGAAGLERSAVVVDHPMAHAQLQRLARAAGLCARERYLNAPAEPDWEARALAWIVHGTEPGDSAPAAPARPPVPPEGTFVKHP